MEAARQCGVPLGFVHRKRPRPGSPGPERFPRFRGPASRTEPWATSERDKAESTYAISVEWAIPVLQRGDIAAPEHPDAVLPRRVNLGDRKILRGHHHAADGVIDHRRSCGDQAHDIFASDVDHRPARIDDAFSTRLGSNAGVNFRLVVPMIEHPLSRPRGQPVRCPLIPGIPQMGLAGIAALRDLREWEIAASSGTFL